MIPLFKVYMSKYAAEASKDVLESGYIGEGEVVKKFEKGIKEYLDADYVATTNTFTVYVQQGRNGLDVTRIPRF